MSCFARLVLRRLRLGGRDFVVDPAQISNWSSMTLLLKPSEYKGDKGTAVAGRVVIMVTQEVKMKESKSLAASPPGKGKGREKQASGFFCEARTTSGGHGLHQRGRLRGGLG